MKLFSKLAVAATMLWATNASAQTAEEIIAKNIEAMGGAAKLETLNSAKQSGTMSTQGMEIPMEFQIVHNVGFRMDVEVMGTSNYQVANKTQAAMFFPVQGMTEPKMEEAEGVEAAQGSLNLRGLLGYKERGLVITFEGADKLDGADVLKLKVTKKDKVSTYFIDAKTFRLSKTVSTNSAGAEMESTFSDYKQNKDGYWFAYTIKTSGMPAPVTYTNIDTNVKIDESIFKP
jgi:outer membrane lipoprotein-sorting protein